MPEFTVQQGEPQIGAAPHQETHSLDGGELNQLEHDASGLYLTLAFSLIPSSLSIGATVAAWQQSLSPGMRVTDTTLGLVFAAMSLLMLGAGAALLIPGLRSRRSRKKLIRNIRKRLPDIAPGTQEQGPQEILLEPVLMNREIAKDGVATPTQQVPEIDE